jgi:hypothetical protein
VCAAVPSSPRSYPHFQLASSGNFGSSSAAGRRTCPLLQTRKKRSFDFFVHRFIPPTRVQSAAERKLKHYARRPAPRSAYGHGLRQVHGHHHSCLVRSLGARGEERLFRCNFFITKRRSFQENQSHDAPSALPDDVPIECDVYPGSQGTVAWVGHLGHRAPWLGQYLPAKGHPGNQPASGLFHFLVRDVFVFRGVSSSHKFSRQPALRLVKCHVTLHTTRSISRVVGSIPRWFVRASVRPTPT